MTGKLRQHLEPMRMSLATHLQHPTLDLRMQNLVGRPWKL